MIGFCAKVDVRGWIFGRLDGAARYKLNRRWEAEWKAMALVFVNANENLNRVVTVGTEMKEQMGELL